jgi:hypothetical protein
MTRSATITPHKKRTPGDKYQGFYPLQQQILPFHLSNKIQKTHKHIGTRENIRTIGGN